MKIAAATAADIPAVANLLGEAFRADPVLLEYLLAPSDPEEMLTRIFTVELETFYIPHGFVDVATEGDQVLGVALWAPPGATSTKKEQLEAATRMARILGRRAFRALRLQRAWREATPRFPHWYLYTLAAGEIARGKGVGGKLLKFGTERAATHPVYLEATSERAASLYERHGFVRLGPIPTSLEAVEIGMWKPAQSAQNRVLC